MRRWSERRPQERAPDGSPAASHPAFEPHPIQGWMPDFIPDVLQEAIDRKLYDEVMTISGAEGLRWAKTLAQKEGDLHRHFRRFDLRCRATGRGDSAAGLGHSLHAAGHGRAIPRRRRCLKRSRPKWTRRRRRCRSRRRRLPVRRVTKARDLPSARAETGVRSTGCETLDPDDWSDAQTVSHEDPRRRRRLSSRGPRPSGLEEACRPTSRLFRGSACRASPTPLAEVYRDVAETVMAYPMGNIHPRFWSWYMGSSNFTGALGDFLAAIQGSNLGGGNHAAALMDQQVVDWCKEMVGFPASAERNAGQRRLDGEHDRARRRAQRQGRRRRARTRSRGDRAAACGFYGSDQIHSLPPQGDRGDRPRQSGACGEFQPMSVLRLDVEALRVAIARDQRGRVPACLRDRRRRGRSTPARSTILPALADARRAKRISGSMSTAASAH